MPTFVNRYIYIINHEANTLLENKFETLTPLQNSVILSILKHTDELSSSASLLDESHHTNRIRHELLNLITPISGYIAMLSDGWMGDLNEHQLDHVHLIVLAVQRLTEYIRNYTVENTEQAASS